MNTTEKLQKALDLMKEAEQLVNEAKEENKSLKSYYGYSLLIVAQELNKFSDNSNYYMTRDTNLQEMIESEGSKWFEDGQDREEDED